MKAHIFTLDPRADSASILSKDAVPTLFLSGLKYLFGKSGHGILLTWIQTLLVEHVLAGRFSVSPWNDVAISANSTARSGFEKKTSPFLHRSFRQSESCITAYVKYCCWLQRIQQHRIQDYGKKIVYVHRLLTARFCSAVWFIFWLQFIGHAGSFCKNAMPCLEGKKGMPRFWFHFLSLVSTFRLVAILAMNIFTKVECGFGVRACPVQWKVGSKFCVYEITRF